MISFLVGGTCVIIMFPTWNFTISKVPMIPAVVAFHIPVLMVCLVYSFVFAAIHDVDDLRGRILPGG